MTEKATLKVSNPFIFNNMLIVNINDDNKLLRNGANFMDEEGRIFQVRNVMIKSYDDGSVDVILDGPKEIGNELTYIA